MDGLSNVQIVPMVDSNFVKPLRMIFCLNGRERKWDLVRVHRSVAIILFNTTNKKMIFVKQFRPAVYYNSIPENDRCGTIDTTKYPASLGYTMEVCAGIVDKAKSLAEIAVEEIYEECGFKTEAEKLEYVIQFRSGVGISGDVQTLYYAEVSEEMRVNSGGGNPEEGEEIELIEMSIKEVEDYLSQPSVSSPGGFLFALQWFLAHKAPHHR